MFSLIEGLSTYSTPFKPRDSTWKHIVLCGPPSEKGINAFAVQSVIEEFIHSDDGIASMHLNKIHFVILSPCEPTQDVTDLLENPKYDGRLMYVKGSPMCDQHLEKVRAGTAEGFFIFVDKYALHEDHREEDTHSILNTLAIKRYRPDARVIVEVLQHESAPRI